ncbi:hypothetical protein ES702_06351 [subsurface metagenome]
MAEEALRDAGEGLGFKPEAKPGEKGRPIGAKGLMPNLKTMSVKDLRSEAGRSRKKVKELEARFEEIGKAEAEAKDAAVMPPEMWGVFPAMIYDYLSGKYGEHWKLNETEVKLYGENLERVANRYLPDFAGNHPELTGLALVAVSTTLPRALQTLSIQKAEADEAQALKTPGVLPSEEKLNG